MGFAANIIAKLGLDSGEFQRELKYSVNLLKTAAGAMGASLTAVGLATFGRAIVNFSSNLADSADALDMNVESLQELDYAFGQSGASAEQVEKAIKQLNQSIADARSGNAKTIVSFNLLGVSWAQLSSQSPDEILMLLADGLKNARDPTAALAAVVDLLGKSGVRMAAGLRKGTDEIIRLREETTKLGKDDVETIDRAGDFLSRMGRKAMVMGSKALLFARQQVLTAGGFGISPEEKARDASEFKGLISSPSRGALLSKSGGIGQPSDKIGVDPTRIAQIEEAAKIGMDAMRSEKAGEIELADINRETTEEQKQEARDLDRIHRDSIRDRMESEVDLLRIVGGQANERLAIEKEIAIAQQRIADNVADIRSGEAIHTAELKKQNVELDGQIARLKAIQREHAIDEKLKSPDQRRDEERTARERERTGRAIDKNLAEREKTRAKNRAFGGDRADKRDPGAADGKPAKQPGGDKSDTPASEKTLERIAKAVEGKFKVQA